MKQLFKLEDIDVSFLSLVPQGANQKVAIYKSAETTQGDTKGIRERTLKIAKNNPEQGTLTVIVYSPDEIDTQGDQASAVEIQKAAHRFMKQLNNRQVDQNHNEIPQEACVVESWILQKNDPTFPNEKEGSWAVVIQLESEALKKAARDGKISGISMGGVSKRSEIQKVEMHGHVSQPVNFKKIVAEALTELFGKSKKTENMESPPAQSSQGAGEWLFTPTTPNPNLNNPNMTPEEIAKAVGDALTAKMQPLNTLETRVEALEKKAQESQQSFEFKKQSEEDSFI